MTSQLNPKRIAQLLTQGAQQLDPKTLSALSDARQNALQKQSIRVSGLTLAADRLAHLLQPARSHQWLASGLLAAMLVIGTSSYWHHANEQQIADLDLAILTDELPIEVFVD